jgi:hypothetical protein
MPIFTSIPTRPNVTPSDKFKEYRNFTDMPCPIFESPIYATSTSSNVRFATMRGNFQYHIAANVLKKEIKAAGYVNTVLPSPDAYVSLVPTPPLGLAFPGMGAPGHVQEVHSLGFSEEAVGGLKFYRGIAEISGLSRVFKLNPIMDNGVPMGLCNPQGLLTFFWISSLVHGVTM